MRDLSKQESHDIVHHQHHHDHHTGHHDPKTVQTFVGSVCSINNSEKDEPFYMRNGCLRISIGIIKEMTDFKLLCQNTGFLLITLSNFFLFTGYFTPFLYIVKIAEDMDYTTSQATFLLSIIGIVNIPFRMLFGFIADRRFVSAINLNTFSILIATVPLFFYEVLVQAYWSYVLFTVLFAIGMGNSIFFDFLNAINILL